jgi:RNA polymerase sigma-70 factor (ECF subfamily)
MDAEEDLLLTRALIRGERFAFQKIFEQEYSRCYTFAYGVIYQREDAQDIVQESFFKLWKNRLTLEESQGYRKWLFRCVFNTAIDFLRRKKKRPLLESHFSELTESEFPVLENLQEETSVSKFQEGLLKQMQQEEIQEVLSRLDEKYRIVILLRCWENLSYKEIAEILQIPLGTAGRRFSVGVAKLEQYFIRLQ